MTTGFAAPEAATFWPYIGSSLDRLVAIGASLDTESLHWQPPAPNANSVAVLIRHTLGNAEENLLGVLFGQSIERQRDAEFAALPTTPEEIAADWRALQPRLVNALAALDPEDLQLERAHPRRGIVTRRDILIVVARHAAEHLGQAELTRDLRLARPQPGQPDQA